MTSERHFDVFLSYSSNDRDSVIVPFLAVAEKRGISSWCDFHEITWGDSIIEKIQEGLSRSAFVIAFISRSYLQKPWPLKELCAALAAQLSGGPTVLPVLLGVPLEDTNKHLPFLCDIKHLSLPSYEPSEVVAGWFLEQLATELKRKKEQSRPLSFGHADEIAVLEEGIKAASYESHYRSFSVLTTTEAMEVHIRDWGTTETARPDFERHLVRMEPLLREFFDRHNINDCAEISCAWADNGRTPVRYFALRSGNIVSPHRASLHNPPGPGLSPEEYARTGAFPDPVCMTVGDRTNEVILGYADGSLYVWGQGKHCLQGHSASITCLDTSLESIVVSGDSEGVIGIWSRRNFELLRMLRSGEDRVCSVCVSRDSGDAIFATGHPNGIIRLWAYDGRAQRTLETGRGEVSALSFFPGGDEYLASASEGRIDIWNYHSGRSLRNLVDRRSEITTLHLNPPPEMWFRIEPRLTAGYSDGHVSSWEIGIIGA